MYALCARLMKRNISNHLYHHEEYQSHAQNNVESRETAFLLQKHVLVARGMCWSFGGGGGGARADGMMGFITPKWGISDTCSALVQRLNHVADG
jgi:hypothetical protein